MTDEQVWEDMRLQYSCIKLPKNTKGASIQGWSEFCSIKNDVGPYDKNSGLAVLAGPASGVIILDVDNTSVFKAKVKEVGWDVRSQRVFKTASNKYHIYIQYSEQLDNWLGNVSRYTSLMETWGCEILINNAYAVAAPTKINGRQYRLLYDNPVGERLPAEMVIDILKTVSKPKKVYNGPVRMRSIIEVFTMTKAPEKLQEVGGRNSFLHWMLNRMQESCPDFDDSEDIIIELVQNHSELSHNEIQRTYQSVIRRR